MRKRSVPIERWMEQQRKLPVGLYWAAFYFKASALLGVAGLAVFLVVSIVAPPKAFPPPSRLVPLLVVWAFMTGCSWWAGRLLEERRRQGGWLALSALLPPVVQWAVRGGTPGLGVLLSALGALAVLTSWRELD